MALLPIQSLPRMRATNLAGAPAVGAKLYCWAAGSSSVAQLTYQDAGGLVPNLAIMVADAGGWFLPCFLLPLAYHFVCTTSDGGETIFDQDNVAGPNYSALLDSSFILKNLTDPTKKVIFDLSSITTATTRTLTAPDASGILTLTTATQTLTNKTLTAPAISAAALTAIASAAMNGTFSFLQGADVVAANDLTLGVGNVFKVTGNTQINRINVHADGFPLVLIFAGTPTVKTGQATSGGFNIILLAGSADLVAASSTVLFLMQINGQFQECGRKVA